MFRQVAGLAGRVTVEDVKTRIPLGDRAPQAAVILSRLFNLAEVPPGDGVSDDTALLVAAEAIRRMLTRPTVVWIEDLQWADPGTRELLPFIVERLHDTPLLVIGSLRAGEEPLAWGRRTAVNAMLLDPLLDDDSRSLLVGITGEPLPASTERALIAKAAGNPFYLTEMLGTLQSAGTLIKDRGRWRVIGSVERVLPDTIQGALLARLDRLAPDLRSLIQRAAVVGASFAQPLIAALSPDADVAGALRKLEDAYLIRRSDPLAADPEFTFANPLLREVAYNSLLSKQQVALHRQIAEEMEQLYADRIDELTKIIGTHFDRAALPDRAVSYLLQAGKQAAGRYATREAIELLERACELANTEQTELCVEASEMLGDLYPRMPERGPKRWFEVWQYVLRHTDAEVDPIRHARAFLGAAFAKVNDNEVAAACQMLEQAEGLIPRDHALWGEYQRVRAQMLLIESKYREALEAAQEAVEVANRQGTLQDRARAYNILAHPAILPLLGEEGHRTMQEWLREAEAAKDERLLIDASLSFTAEVWTRGIVDEDILRMSEQALGKATEYGWTADEAELRVLRGWASFLLGEWVKAEGHLRRARDVVEGHGGRIHRFGILLLLPYAEGNLAMGRGRLDEARQIFEDGLAKVRFHAPIWLNHDLARCHLLLGNVNEARAAMEQSLLARDRIRCIICGCQANGIAAEFYASLGDVQRAASLIAEAEPTAREIGHRMTLIRGQRARARLALQAAEPQNAVGPAREGVELFAQMPLSQPFEHGQSLLLLGDAYMAARDQAHAIAVWQEARGLFSRLGASWHLQRVEDALSRAGVPT